MRISDWSSDVCSSDLPKPDSFSVCLSSFRRPAPNMAPPDAKASCLSPNSARALNEASKRGFDNAVVLDALGNVAELSTAHLWIANDGVAVTPEPNGTLLTGITKIGRRAWRERVGQNV